MSFVDEGTEAVLDLFREQAGINAILLACHTFDRGTDLEAVGDGFISVTPLQLDLTHHAALGALAARYAG